MYSTSPVTSPPRRRVVHSQFQPTSRHSAPENIPSSPANSRRLVQSISKLLRKACFDLPHFRSLQPCLAKVSLRLFERLLLRNRIGRAHIWIVILCDRLNVIVTLRTRIFFHNGYNRCSCINCTNFTNIAMLLNPVSTSLSIWAGNVVDSARQVPKLLPPVP